MLVLVQRPQHKSTPDPVAAPKNIPYDTIFIEFGDTKKCCTFSGLELAPKAEKSQLALSAACTKAPNAFNPFGSIRKKFLLCKSAKKVRYVRSLGKKNPFLAFPEAKKGVVNCARLRKAAHWHNNNANPLGLSEKKVYCVEKRDMCDP